MSLSKSASDRVLFNEDYMHMILPYLPTTDLKSVRLVTPFWNKIGTKFLSRKSFKPLRFSDLSRKDFATLKRGIEGSRPEEDPRIKLFKGFHLAWPDVAIIKNCNFIALFKPSQIIIEGRDVSPGSSLTSLLTPILDTLTDVTLQINWDILRNNFSILEKLVQLEGMRLKVLHIEIFQDNKGKYQGSASILHKILSDLLASQASTLEELVLKIECNIRSDNADEKDRRRWRKELGRGFSNKDEESRIKLPIFPHLTSLTLALKIKNPRMLLGNFETFNFVEKFPNLVLLDLNKLILREMSAEFYMSVENTFDLTIGHPLKKLILDFTESVVFNNPIHVLNKLRISFPSVEEFAAKGLYFRTVIPWVDTLRNLEISGYTSNFNLVHLKKIETFHFTHQGMMSRLQDVNGLINRLLNHYQELSHLKKFHISGLEITAEQMTQIQRGLPAQFLEILTFDESFNSESDEDAEDTDSDTD